MDADSEKTIPLRRLPEFGSGMETMPGKRDRKPDGRFVPGDLIPGRCKVVCELGQGGMGVKPPESRLR